MLACDHIVQNDGAGDCVSFGFVAYGEFVHGVLVSSVGYFRGGCQTAKDLTYPSRKHLYNFDLYIVKLGFTWVYIIFLISTQKHR